MLKFENKDKILKEHNCLRITLQEVFYYAFWGILLFAKGIGLYEGMLSFNICILLALLFMGLKIVITGYTLYEWITILFMTICSVFAYFQTGEKAAIITILVIIGIKNIPVKRVMKLSFIIWSITFYTMLIVHLLGLKEGVVLAHNKFGLGFILRYSLGFPHPNVLHISFILWMALLLYLVSVDKRKLIKISVFLFLENVFIFIFSVSITGFLIGMFYLILNSYFTTKKKSFCLEKVVIQSVLPLCIFVSIVPPLIFKGKLYDIVNKILNTRLTIWNYYLLNFSPAPFGVKVYSPAEEVWSLDNSYLYLLYYYGWILFVILLSLTSIVILKYVKNNRKKELMIIVGMLIAGITEPYLFNFSFKNFILLFIGREMFNFFRTYNKREISLIRIRNRIITMPVIRFELYSSLREMVNSFTYRRKIQMIVCEMIIAFILVGNIFYLYQKPTCIYVQSNRCDYVKGEGSLYEEISDEPNVQIFGERDDNKTFYGFSGNMILLEFGRKILVYAVSGVILGRELFILICFIKNRKIEKREHST